MTSVDEVEAAPLWNGERAKREVREAGHCGEVELCLVQQSLKVTKREGDGAGEIVSAR